MLRKCNVCGDWETGSVIWRNYPAGGRVKVLYFQGFLHNFLKSCVGYNSREVLLAIGTPLAAC